MSPSDSRERRGPEGAAAATARALWRFSHWVARIARGEVVKRVGGPARARVITLFAIVLALNGADTATVGAVAPQLEHALHIGNARIGLLAAVSLLVGAVFTIPVGLFVDRAKRIPLLAFSIILWSLASMASALAGSYSDLLLSRLALGAVAATAGPAIASLTGDYFDASERGRVWAYILAGEVFGTAIGFIVSGSVASLIDWRAAFVVLAIPGFFLARELWRTVPEPLRGGQSHLAVGAVDLHLALAAASRRGAASEAQAEPEPGPDHEAARAAARREGAVANPRLVLTEDPRRMGLLRSVRYILSVPTNWMLIVGSSLGYFYLAGLNTFALLFVKGQYGADQAKAELVLALLVGGALVGTIVGGRVTDVLLEHGTLKARVLFPAGCYIAAGIVMIPGFLGHQLTPALWFDILGAALLSAANPPIQAARLDIIPAGLWGRAESTRTFVRSLAQALSPLVFGGLASLVSGFLPSQAPIGTHPKQPTVHTATGLQVSFLVMLATLIAAGVFLARASRTYASDVATAEASEEPLRARQDRAAAREASRVAGPAAAADEQARLF